MSTELTETEVHAWLSRKFAECAIDLRRLRQAQVDISSNRDPERCVMAYAYTDDAYNSVSGYGTTIHAAIMDMVGKIPSLAEIAARKRSEAEKLISEASAIEASLQSDKHGNIL